MIAFDNFYTDGNRNEYPTKQAYTMSLRPYYVSTLPGKTKNSTKRPAAYLMQCILLNRVIRSMFVSFPVC